MKLSKRGVRSFSINVDMSTSAVVKTLVIGTVTILLVSLVITIFFAARRGSPETCPEGYDLTGNRSFCLHLGPSGIETRAMALSYCRSKVGGRLVEILSQTDQNEMEEYVMKIRSVSVWLGLELRVPTSETNEANKLGPNEGSAFSDDEEENNDENLTWMWDSGVPAEYLNWDRSYKSSDDLKCAAANLYDEWKWVSFSCESVNSSKIPYPLCQVHSNLSANIHE